MAEGARPLPAPTPETKHFWEGTKAGELRLQRCDDCRHTYFPPRPFCPKCASRKVSVLKAAGKAKLFSYVIHHRPAPGFTPPYAIAVVDYSRLREFKLAIYGSLIGLNVLVLGLGSVARGSRRWITLPFFKPTSAK